MYKKILVPLDRSPLSESVLPHIEKLAELQGAEQYEVVLLNVCEVPLIPDYYLIEIPLNWKDHVTRCRQDAEKYLVKMEKRLKTNVINIKTVVLMAESGEGSPADYIVDYANSNDFDLLIMSTRGRSGLSRWAFGSVADKIIRRVSTPILLIKP